MMFDGQHSGFVQADVEAGRWRVRFPKPHVSLGRRTTKYTKYTKKQPPFVCFVYFVVIDISVYAFLRNLIFTCGFGAFHVFRFS